MKKTKPIPLTTNEQLATLLIQIADQQRDKFLRYLLDTFEANDAVYDIVAKNYNIQPITLRVWKPKKK